MSHRRTRTARGETGGILTSFVLRRVSLFLFLGVALHASDARREASRLYQEASRDYLEADYRRAAELLRKSVSLNGDNPRPIKLLGICYQLTGNLEDAASMFHRAAGMNPRDTEARFFLARVRYLQNSFEKALAELEVARSLTPHDVRVLELMALSHEATSQIDRAVADYEEAVAWNAKSDRPLATVHLNFGVLLHKLNRLGESERQLRKAGSLDAKDWQAPFELAKLCASQGKLDEAIRKLKIASEAGTARKKDLTRVYSLLAQYCSQVGRADESQSALAMARRLEE
jgi:tetratricopeptide (TPR) repeat protein